MIGALLATLFLVVLALVVERTRELGFRAPLGLGPIAGRDRAALLAALARDAPDSAPGTLARVVSGPCDPSGADDVDLEVQLHEQDRRLRRGLRMLRVLAACASALGFVGAIVAMRSIHDDHGLLGLDPTPIVRAALGEASVLLALGLGTSAFALSSLVALQGRARDAVRELHRVAELCRSGRDV